MDTDQCKGAADTDGRSGEIENANAEAYRGQTCCKCDRSVNVLPTNDNIDDKPAETGSLLTLVKVNQQKMLSSGSHWLSG